MSSPLVITPFILGDLQLALCLEAVDRVERAVAITPLPGAPAIVLGVINVHGTVIPVVDVRRRFLCPARPLCATDHFVLARTRTRRVAIVADRVLSPVEVPDASLARLAEGLPGNRYFKGVAELEHGLVLIHDLDAFLSFEEDETLQHALDHALTVPQPQHA